MKNKEQLIVTVSPGTKRVVLKFKKGTLVSEVKKEIWKHCLPAVYQVKVKTKEGRVLHEHTVYASSLRRTTIPGNWTDVFRRAWTPNLRKPSPRKWVPAFHSTAFAQLCKLIRESKATWWLLKREPKLKEEGYIVEIEENKATDHNYEITKKGVEHVIKTLKKDFRFMKDTFDGETLTMAMQLLEKMNKEKPKEVGEYVQEK